MADDAPAAAPASGSPAAPAGAAGASAGGAAAAPATTWYTGLDPDLAGLASHKGWKLDDPKEAFSNAAKAYKEAQSKFGVPPEELIRRPKVNAAPEDIKKFREAMGAPKEAKEYDLSSIKFPADFDAESFASAIRNGAFEVGLSKEAVATAYKPIIKMIDDARASKDALLSAQIVKEQAELDLSWGNNKERNLHIAKSFLANSAAKVGWDLGRVEKVWDGISRVPGAGAAEIMKMLLEWGVQTGEGNYVSGGAGGENMPLSREGALARIEQLKKDTEWTAKYLKGGRKETDEMHGLHTIAYPERRRA